MEINRYRVDIDTVRRCEMQTIDEVREHCRFVGKGIEMACRQTGFTVWVVEAPPRWRLSQLLRP